MLLRMPLRMMPTICALFCRAAMRLSETQRASRAAATPRSVASAPVDNVQRGACAPPNRKDHAVCSRRHAASAPVCCANYRRGEQRRPRAARNSARFMAAALQQCNGQALLQVARQPARAVRARTADQTQTNPPRVTQKR